ncbi:histone deacetylase 8-like [Watersipora subatra]|uniref:histone deacetylase 8-like n=1 Tax=Watersipora subatra TaxID=2589382 RepID=UPI00355B411C
MRVGYAYSQEMVQACDMFPRIKGRASLCAELIEAYGLHAQMWVLEPRELSIDELSSFHSRDYLETFKKVCELDDPEKIDKEIAEDCGLGYDCPVEEGLFPKCALVAGGSIVAAEALVEGQVDVAINWCGGWHHAKRFNAAGFCYINDIVLAAQKLREKFERVLYIDIDLHHGDGVEDAFWSTNKVYCMSLHKYSPGFYPGSGGMEDVGEGKGRHYTLNIPLADGITTEQYMKVFNSALNMVIKEFIPHTIICQCGADGLAMDEMDSFNLSSSCYVRCVSQVLDLKLPTLLLGGGGYHFANTARTWASLTAAAIGVALPCDIPSDMESFMEYKPDFELMVPAGNRPNMNKDSDIERILNVVKGSVNMMSATDEPLDR